MQLYRDHQALLTVIDALTLRAHYNPLAKEACRARQQGLLKRAIAFHDKCHHHHVVARLEALRANLCNRLFALPQETVEIAELASQRLSASSINPEYPRSTLWQQPSHTQRTNREHRAQEEPSAANLRGYRP